MPRLTTPLIAVLVLPWAAACGDGPAPTPTAPANRPPVAVAALGDQSVEEGTQVTVDVSGAFSDPDGDTLGYAAASAASDVATATVSGSEVTVTGVAAGAAVLTVTATDPGGLGAGQSFRVTVTAANRAPVAAVPIPDQGVVAGSQVALDVSGAFSDPDGDTLSYAASSDAEDVAAAMVLESEVVVTGVAAGTAMVAVTATDPRGLGAAQSFRVTVTPANRPPAAAVPIPDQGVVAGAQVTVDVSGAFSDPDGDTLGYAASSDAEDVAAAMVLGSEVIVTGVAAGTTTITVTATDPGGLAARQSFAVTVEAAPVVSDLDSLFAPPTPAEIAMVEAEWETRMPETRGVEIELDTVVERQSATLRVRILSHTVGGLRHYGAVVTPPDAEPGSLPVLVFTHGGDNGVELREVFLMNALLEFEGRGVGLVAPSYRSEPLEFDDRVFVSDGPASPWDRDVDDTMWLLSVAIEAVPELNKERVAVLGISRGAGVGLLAGVRDPRIDAVVEAAGPTDLFDDYAREILEEALAGNVRDLPGVEYLDETLIQPWKRGELTDAQARLELLRRSAAYFVDRLPPVQLHHGTADGVVAVSQAHRLIEAMREAGKGKAEFEAHLYEGAGHSLLDLLSGGAATHASEFLRAFLFEPG